MPRPQRLRGAYGPPPAVATQPSRSGELPPAYVLENESDEEKTSLATLTGRGEFSNTYGFEENSTAGRSARSSHEGKTVQGKGKNKLTASEFLSINSDSQGQKGENGRGSGAYTVYTLRGSNRRGRARGRGKGRGEGRSVWNNTERAVSKAKATQAQSDSSSVNSGSSSTADPPSTAVSSVQADDEDTEDNERVIRLVSLFFSSGGKATLVSVPADGVLENP